MKNTAIDIKQDLAPDIITKEDVKKYLCAKATDKEIEMFLITCRLHNLNPLKREAYLIKYGTEPAQTVVGYESYIKRAEATGQLNGWECWIDGDKAKVRIYRKDREHPFQWEVDRAEFDKGRAMWKSMGNHMLKKVAISQSFRLYFASDIGGMPYTKEEMPGEVIEHAEIPPETPQDVPDKPPEQRSQETNPTAPEIAEYLHREALLDGMDDLIEKSGYDKKKMSKTIEKFTTKELEKFANHLTGLIKEVK